MLLPRRYSGRWRLPHGPGTSPCETDGVIPGLAVYGQGHEPEHLAAIHDEFARLYEVEAGEPFAIEIEFKITSENILATKQARPWVFSPELSLPGEEASPER